MTEPQVQDSGALDEVLAWNGVVHVFPREASSMRSNMKYLWIFPAVASIVTAYVISLYMITKDRSGPLKPGIQRIEGLVMKTVRPIYQTIQYKLTQILVFLDRKVDYILYLLDGVLPPTLKELSSKTFDATKSTVDDVQKYGIYCTAKACFDRYEPVVESYGIQAYKKALRFPLVPQAVACSRYSAVRFNNIIVRVKESGLPLASFLPLLPVDYLDKITRSE
ncbi:unnamed protein product [Calypogeia fissa]